MPAIARPSAIDFQRRLAAAGHRRRIDLLVRIEQAAARIGSLYRSLAGECASAAAEAGPAGWAEIVRRVEDVLAAARARVEDALVDSARRGVASAADALLDAMPKAWLPLLMGVAAAKFSEATEPTEPSEWETTFDLPQRAVADAKAAGAVREMLLAVYTPANVQRWLSEAPPGGLSWNRRLRRWETLTRAAMLNELSAGLIAGENVDRLRARLQPYADGLAWKAQRIARTEGCRAAERAGRAGYEELGGLLDGLQIVAAMDEWTRPRHAARNGRIYRRGYDGVYRDERGELLPDLPDEPNCRCMTIPVLALPAALRRDKAAMAAFRTATGKLIPDPSSYGQWWQSSGERQRTIAVGVQRYQTVRDALRRLPVPREPEWEDFIDAEGRLLPVEHLRSESPEERDERRRKIDFMLAQRQKFFQHVAGAGAVLPGTTGGENAILNRDHARLMHAIAARVRAYQDHFRLTDEERRRQRAFQQEEHTVEEIRREILRRKAMWEERQRTAPDVAIDDLPPQYRRDARQRLAVVRDQLDRHQKELFRSALYLPEAAQSDIRLQTAGLPGPIRDRAERGARFVGRVVRKNVLAQAEIPIIIVPTLEDEGAGYNETLRAILAHPNAADHAFVHEIGHDLSMRLPNLNEKAKMWRRQVTRGGSLKAGSTKDSVGDYWFYRQQTDGVPQVRPIDQYITREYPDHDAHEVISVGLEQLFVEPERIAEEDQNLFELLLKGFRR